MNMTRNGTNVKQRDIVFLPFPFSDLSSTKKRPVLVISGNAYNAENKNVICCALTSNPQTFRRGVRIRSKDLDSGNLNFESAVIPCKVFCPHKDIILTSLGRLSVRKSIEVVRHLRLRIRIEE